MIVADGLVKHFRGGDGTLVKAVDGVSFTVEAGEMVGLLGANGVGKTTTMRLLATLLAPTAGTASVGGCDIVGDPLGVRRQLGYLSATTGVPDRLTPREVLWSFGRLHGLDEERIAARVDELLTALGLSDCMQRPCGRLSTGQRQRVSLGRALVHDPQTLVLDEPTSGLDVIGARDLLDLLERLRDEGRAVLVSTHRLHEIERRCDRFLIIHAGRIAGGGTREELAAAPGGLEAAFFTAVDAGGRP
jgi:sodium transport system ATP-binding protein